MINRCPAGRMLLVLALLCLLPESTTRPTRWNMTRHATFRTSKPCFFWSLPTVAFKSSRTEENPQSRTANCKFSSSAEHVPTERRPGNATSWETQSWLFIIAMISLKTVRSSQAAHSYVSIPHLFSQTAEAQKQRVRSVRNSAKWRAVSWSCPYLAVPSAPGSFSSVYRAVLPSGLPHGIFPTHSTPPCP
jgi:hypothetical protein